MQRRSPRRRRVSCWRNAKIAYAPGGSFAIMGLSVLPKPTQTCTRGHNREHISSIKFGSDAEKISEEEKEQLLEKGGDPCARLVDLLTSWR